MYELYERPELNGLMCGLLLSVEIALMESLPMSRPRAVDRMFGEGILLVLFLVQKHSSASQRKRAVRLGRTAL